MMSLQKALEHKESSSRKFKQSFLRTVKSSESVRPAKILSNAFKICTFRAQALCLVLREQVSTQITKHDFSILRTHQIVCNGIHVNSKLNSKVDLQNSTQFT